MPPRSSRRPWPQSPRGRGPRRPGELALDDFQLEQAEASLGRAMEINPTFARRLAAQGRCGLANDQTGEALRLLREKLLPLNPLYQHNGAYMVDPERIGGRYCLYRWHTESPITFDESIKVTIEHGHANHRSDDFYSVAYWYQTEPHAEFPTLPSAADRIPKMFDPGGPAAPTIVPGS